MKHGSEYAQQVKRLYRQMLKQSGKPELPAATDPIEQLIVAILSACTTDHKAAAVYHRLRELTVDLNELRVTPAVELAEMIGAGVPLAREKAQRIVDALNAVRRRQDKLDLSFLQQRTRREAREFLESLEGVDKATAASVVLFSLAGHAIPVDDLILYVLRQEGIVDAEADLAEVQAFLERTIPAEETAAFSLLLSRYAAQKAGRVPVEKLRQLLAPSQPAAPPPPPPPPALPPPPVPIPVDKPVPGKLAATPAPGKDGKQDGHSGKPEKSAKSVPASLASPGAAIAKKAAPGATAAKPKRK